MAFTEDKYTVNLEAALSAWCFQMFGRMKCVRRKMI